MEDAMTVHDIMSAPPRTCRVDTALATASARMKQTSTGMLVVLSDRGRIAGVITDRDLAMAIGTTGGEDLREHRVGDFMTGRVHSCRETDEIHQALATMTAAHVRRLPVLGQGEDLVGVVSIDDIILWAVRRRGVSATELAGALRGICLPRPGEEDAEVPAL
jgi:signal-transduction protein with cAMP-binding, CBS, and nucleotidyltransferase domain